MPTRTGAFPIGFRRGWSDWQKKDLGALIAWAEQTGFEMIDLGAVSDEDLQRVKSSRLKLGSADLVSFGKVMSADDAERRETIRENVEYVRRASTGGAKVFFTCMMPADKTRSRREIFDLAIESFGPVIEAARASDSVVAIEGYPGGPPWYADVGCTPESIRAFIKHFGGKGVGINYDPSHLVRIGVDPVRFLKEFLPHVRHVHAKDTELDHDAMYEFGNMGSVFTKPHGFGEWTWRYTIPGHGVIRWTELLRILADAGYQGGVSVELEDEHFNGSEEGEKAGLIHSLNYLRSV